MATRPAAFAVPPRKPPRQEARPAPLPRALGNMSQSRTVTLLYPQSSKPTRRAQASKWFVVVFIPRAGVDRSAVLHAMTGVACTFLTAYATTLGAPRPRGRRALRCDRRLRRWLRRSSLRRCWLQLPGSDLVLPRRLLRRTDRGLLSHATDLPRTAEKQAPPASRMERQHLRSAGDDLAPPDARLPNRP